MAEFNTIKLNQIDQDELSNLISSTLTGDVVSYLTDYIDDGGTLGAGLVYSFSNQSIDGKKSFILSPAVPYSGGTGDAVSRRFVEDKLAVVTSAISSINSNSYVYSTGEQSIAGIKSFSDYALTNYIGQISGDDTANGINLATLSLIDSGGDSALNWGTRTLSDTWTFNQIPTIASYQPVLTNSAQTIDGEKSFIGSVLIKDASVDTNPVSFGQFKAQIARTEDELSDLISLTANSVDPNGFAGVLSVNGIKGNIFTQGRGSVTVKQIGNVLSISGDAVDSTTSFCSVLDYALSTTGSDIYRIPFGKTFDEIPLVFPQLVPPSGVIYQNYASGIDKSGFSLVLGSTLAHTGIRLNALVIDKTGLSTVLRGEQGLAGQSPYSAGGWATGRVYDTLDFVSLSNYSWICKSGHIASIANGPTGISGSSYWNLMAYGPRGYNGSSVFSWGGNWQSSETYESGTAVFYNGSSYATNDSSSNQPPTGEPWFLVSKKGDSGISFKYVGVYDINTNYSEGQSVSFDGNTYVVPSDVSISGEVNNPYSSFSKWVATSDRAIRFNGDYLASRVYRKNDLAYTKSGYGVSESIQYIYTDETPAVSFHPNNYYNSFIDCSGVTGYNLLELSIINKGIFNPDYNNPSSTKDIAINGLERNFDGSGYDTLTLIRDKVYYFDNEDNNLNFILATQSGGGNYDSQYVNGVTTGARLLVGASNYEAMAFDMGLRSGSMRFAPTDSTPDLLYLVSSQTGSMGWPIRIVDENPWKVFTSGVIGKKGESGASIKGDPGLAFSWKGNWSNLLGYNSGDSVFYNGSSYATNSSIISTAPPNSPWFVVASKGDAGAAATGLSFVWRGSWNALVQYQANESVFYNGNSYATLSAPSIGLTPPSSPWFLVASKGDKGDKGDVGVGIGFTWAGSYSPVNNYISGMAVYYQGSSYGTTGTVSGFAPTGGAPWTILAAGNNAIFNWRNTWSPSETYHSGDAIFHSGSSYACFSTNYNSNPGLSSLWTVLAQKGDSVVGPQGVKGDRGSGGLAFDWRGNWDASFSYAANDSVYYDGSSYGTVSPITDPSEKLIIPPNNTKWALIAKRGDPGLAFVWKGNWNDTTLYKPYESVYYSGRSYATTSYVTVGTKPTNAPWFVVAGMGGDEFCYTHYFGTGFPLTGAFASQHIAVKNGHITGLTWGMAVSSVGLYGISGTVYKTDYAGSTTNLFNFNVKTGVHYWSGNANHSIARFDRIGVHLSGNETDAADIQRLSVGLLGYYSGN